MSDGDKKYVGPPHVGEPQPRTPNTQTQSKVLNLISNRQAVQAQAQSADQSGSTEAGQAPKAEGTMRQLSLPVAPSGLSIHAAVFVPKSQQVPKVQNHVQPGRQGDGYGADVSANASDYYVEGQNGGYAHNPENADCYLGNYFGELTVEDTYDEDQPYYTTNYNQASIEERFDLAMKILTTNPSNVEEYLKPICEDLAHASNSDKSTYDGLISRIVENLYQQCIREDNFRYIGARVCKHLNSTLNMDPTFIKLFVRRCRTDFDLMDQLVHGGPDDKKKLRGLAMLLAELFLNVETSVSDGSIEHLSFLPSILIQILGTLLSATEDANVKCACQLLKLSGSLIEDVVKSNPDDCMRFEALFDSLKNLSKSALLSENAKFHVEKIVKLKDNSWTEAWSPQGSTIANPYTTPPYYQGGSGGSGYQGQDQEAIFYEDQLSKDDDSVSHLLTEEEEADFLVWQNDQFDGYNQDPGMGNEMEEAYEEFLKSQAPAPKSSASPYKYQQPTPAAAPVPPPHQDYATYHHQHGQGQYGNYYSQDNHYHQPQSQAYQHPQYNQSHQHQQQYHYNAHSHNQQHQQQIPHQHQQQMPHQHPQMLPQQHMPPQQQMPPQHQQMPNQHQMPPQHQQMPNQHQQLPQQHQLPPQQQPPRYPPQNDQYHFMR